MSGSRLAGLYTRLAARALSLFLVFVWVNLLAWGINAVLAAREKSVNPVSRKYGRDLAEYYRGLSKEEINELLRVTWNLAPQYDPFSGRRVAPLASRFVNVTEAGFRNSLDQASWPPDRNQERVVYFYGGSTAFGFGVPDGDTIPSQLFSALSERDRSQRWAIFNFAVPAHQSTLERMQLEARLVDGPLPDVAVFLDGYNDCNLSHEPLGTATVREVLDRDDLDQPSWLLWRGAKRLPAARLFSRLLHAARLRSSPAEAALPAPSMVIERYRRNIRLVAAAAREFGVRPLFVWQPIPDYGYDPKLHAFADLTRLENRPREAVYAEMERLWRSGVLGEDFVWCAHLNEGATEPLYLDVAHYTAGMSARIAECIAQALNAPLDTRR